MTTVFVNGCFDVLHLGHLELLSYAKRLGDRLVVAIDSDARVAKAKPGRPIFNQVERLYMLCHLRMIDEVFTFDTDDSLRNLIKFISPDFMVVGSDWKGKEVIGSEHAKEIVFYDRIPDYSTTDIINRIKNA